MAKRKVIDVSINLGYELAAVGRCQGYQEYMSSELAEATLMMNGIREKYNTPWPQPIPLTLDDLIETMDEANVVQGVITGMDYRSKAPWYTKKPYKPMRLYCPSDYVKEVIDKYPKRFKGLAGIDPMRPREDVLDEIKRCMEEWGFAGIKLMPLAGYYPSDKELLYPIYERCVDLDAVVCIESSHTCWYKSRVYSQTPLQIGEIAQDFPELRLHILCGGERTWRHNDAMAVCMNCPNVNMDTSPSLPELWTSYHNCPEEFKMAATLVPDHLMFASEYPLCYPISRGIEGLESIEGVSEEFLNKVFYENAKKFYRLEALD